MFRQYRLRNYSFPLIASVIALASIGIMVIGSAQRSSQTKQIYGLAIGIFMMFTLSIIDFGVLIRLRWIFYVAGCGLLVAVLIVGITAGGASRWINIGIQFQPSDLMKLFLILFFAGYFSRHEMKLNTFRVIFTSLIILFIPLLLIYREPDLSTTVVTMMVFCAIIFVAGLRWRIVITLIAIIVPSSAIFLSIILKPDQTLIAEYQRERILSWLWPSEYYDTAYQQQNSIIAIGSGQLYGKGLDNDAIDSVKNGNFISEPQTDFIFAVAGEELGFVGCIAIILLELFISVMCIRIGMKARERAGMLFCIGVGSLIMFQSGLNIGVATGLLPNTGITLPFVSYGVTSLVTFFMEIGIVLNVGLQRKKITPPDQIVKSLNYHNPFD